MNYKAKGLRSRGHRHREDEEVPCKGKALPQALVPKEPPYPPPAHLRASRASEGTGAVAPGPEGGPRQALVGGQVHTGSPGPPNGSVETYQLCTT